MHALVNGECNGYISYKLGVESEDDRPHYGSYGSRALP